MHASYNKMSQYDNFSVCTNMAEHLPSVQKPSIVATTSLPKSALSYKWVILDAKVLLEENKDGLVSPNFEVPLPCKVESTSQTGTSSWHLHVRMDKYKRMSISLWQGKDYYSNSDQKWSGDDFMVSQCVFSTIDSKKNVVTYTSTSFSKRCKRYKSFKEVVATDSCYSKADDDNYTDIDGTLTIRVTASLLSLCFSKRNDTQQQFDVTETIASKSPLYDGVKALLDARLFVDVTIKCGGKEFTAHKVVLASQSPVLKRMLDTNMKEKMSSIIEISDTDPEVISEVLTYLYTGKVSHKNSTALLAIANKYGISPLFAVCEKYLQLNITVSNAVELLVLADLHEASALKKSCLKYIYRNSTEVRDTVQWKRLKHNSLPLLIEAVEFIPGC